MYTGSGDTVAALGIIYFSSIALAIWRRVAMGVRGRLMILACLVLDRQVIGRTTYDFGNVIRFKNNITEKMLLNPNFDQDQRRWCAACCRSCNINHVCRCLDHGTQSLGLMGDLQFFTRTNNAIYDIVNGFVYRDRGSKTANVS
jgi:hypothetical protein